MAHSQTIQHQFQKLPGPKNYFLLGSIPEIAPDTLKFFAQLQTKYGDVCRFYVGPHPFLYLGNPQHIQYILQENYKNYVKSVTYEVLKLFLGNGLLTSEGDLWRKQRKNASPYFQYKQIARFSEFMVDIALKWVEEHRVASEKSEIVNMSKAMMEMALAIVNQALFTRPIEDEAKLLWEHLATILEFSENRIQSIIHWPLWLPTPANYKFNQACEKLNSIIYRLIRERQKNPSGYEDLLSNLLLIRDEETGQAMSEEQLRDEIMTLFLAGHETTANGLTWTWYLLSQHPRCWQDLQKEWKEVLQGRPPTFEDVEALQLTQRVILESMRLYPPVWAIERRAIEADEIEGIPIPANTNILLCSYTTHHNPTLWENPEGFDPDRFLPERVKQRHKFAYFPFGGGPRVCIGNHFALVEMVLLVSTIGQHYYPQLVPAQFVAPESLIVLRPKNPLMVTLKPL